jgi:hypothetical protein
MPLGGSVEPLDDRCSRTMCCQPGVRQSRFQDKLACAETRLADARRRGEMPSGDRGRSVAREVRLAPFEEAAQPFGGVLAVQDAR